MPAEPRPIGMDGRWRGQPLAFLGTILIVWVMARMAMLAPAAMPARLHPDAVPMRISPPSGAAPIRSAGPRAGTIRIALTAIRHERERPDIHGHDDDRADAAAPPHRIDAASAAQQQMLWLDALVSGARTSPLLLAERPLATLDAGQDASAAAAQDRPAATVPAAPLRRSRRWSGYGWALVRGGGRPAVASAGQYGGSQSGLILRYRAFGEGRVRAELFVRATTALATSDRQLAFGASWTPLATLPASLSVEQRLAIGGGGRSAPAAFIAGGGTLSGLPLDGRVDSYGQAGLLGLARTQAFFDLQMLAKVPVAEARPAVLEAGAGLWAGGQTERDPLTARRDLVYRVDIGPRAALVLPLAERSVELALDWRLRVAGDAAPDSGLALVLAGSF